MEHITEDYCDKELTGLLISNGYIGHRNIYLDKDGFKSERISLQSAMKWLRENYNIHIEVRYFPTPNIYRYVIIHSPATFENIDSHPQYFDSYEEACEAAIQYCLQNFI